MQPYLKYGWQPQVMAVDGRLKIIRSGRLELYDVVDDPGEERDLARLVEPASARAAAEYPLPSPTRPPQRRR